MTRLNDQIRLLIMMQKKSKASQQTISKEIKDAFKAIDRMKTTLIFDELGNNVGGDRDEMRKAAKSQQQVHRPRRNEQGGNNDSFGPFPSANWETSQDFIRPITTANDSINDTGPGERESSNDSMTKPTTL